ncbi:MAG: PGPGW domain-containing protein [Thermoleophilaceae bacterium]|nr:PGPGW domain-containing protein [Thermoleophilaceae bacterium]
MTRGESPPPRALTLLRLAYGRIATPSEPPESASEDETGPAPGPREDDRPELLIKLQERKERHAQRGILTRVLVVVAGVLLVIAGIVLSGPGIPGPGFLVILLGLSFLALEFDRAERLLERAIVAANNAKDRAENASPRRKALTAAVAVLALAAFVTAAVLYDIPLLPFV